MKVLVGPTYQGPLGVNCWKKEKQTDYVPRTTLVPSFGGYSLENLTFKISYLVA